MKVILLQDVPNVGKTGELVDVKDGFFRNYLWPKKLAEICGKKAVGKILADLQKKNDGLKKNRQASEEKINALAGKKITFEVKVNAQNHPYKAITKKDIAKMLAVDEGIILAEPLKSTGVFKVKAKSGQAVAEIIVEIKPEK